MKKLLLILTILLFLTACAKQQAVNNMPKNIRQPAVAGQFYPAEPDKLKAEIEKFLNQATSSQQTGEVKAMMVPHAGYDFSGPVAADGYKLLTGRKIKTVVLIGNSHQAYFSGLAIDTNDVWQTPLGAVAVDKTLANKLISADDSIKFNGQPHQSEHSLEVQLPFLQTVLAEGFKIVPILFGNEPGDDWQKLAQALAKNLGPDDLVIASSDMSHYPADQDAQQIDRATLEKIKAGRVTDLKQYISQIEAKNIANEQTLLCGAEAVKTIMALAQAANWPESEIIRYADSWQTSKMDESRVVGYGVVAFAKTTDDRKQTTENKEDTKLNEEEQNELLKIAKETVRSFVASGTVPQFNISDERLQQKQGAFVTLYKNGLLRGCIGLIEPSDKPLWQVVRDMAIAAASQDTRFSPVSKGELASLRLEVSVLSVPRSIDDWRKIVLGRDGVIIQKGNRSGVFLPQVATETGWSLEEFLAQLCWQKAGLAPDDYKSKEVELEVFTAQVFSTD